MSDKMRVALGQFDQATDSMLRFAKQLGVSGVLLNTPVLPGEKRWEYMDLVQLRATVEDYGLRLEALENVPLKFYDKAMLGQPERDEQIANYQETIRNVGRAGIPILGYHWMPNSVWRTSTTTLGRGGAHVTSFDLSLVQNAPFSHGRVFDEDEMWENYAYFMKAVLPVAEEYNVKLALHPDDPPVESLGGVARLFRNFEGFKRGVVDVAPSPNHGLDFCMGCWSEMGKGVIEPIKYFGSLGKIIYVHFRDVQGVVPKFQECFIGEGNVNTVEAMRTLKSVGFSGFFIDDHVPHMVDDSDFGHRGRAHATGYILGLVAAVEALG
jgi:mannonate dehydratase